MTTAKLFQNGRSQAVRLPKEFRFSGKVVYIKKMGNGVLLLPTEGGTWDAFFEARKRMPADFMAGGREQLPIQERDALLP